MSRRSALSLASLAASLCLTAGAAQAQTVVTFSSASTHINVGDSTTIDMYISGLGSEILAAFDLNFTWADGVLGLNARDFSAGLAQLGAGAVLDEDAPVAGDFGILGYAVLSDADLGSFQADAFKVASFTLDGVSNGSTVFTLGANPDFARNFVGRDFQTLMVDVGSLCVSVGSGDCAVGVIPEPSTYALMLLGLGGVAALARRRARPRLDTATEAQRGSA